jgi:hypothetical protein
MPAAALTDDETFTELNGSQSGRKTSISVHTLDILSVNELLESVRARLVSSLFSLIRLKCHYLAAFLSYFRLFRPVIPGKEQGLNCCGMY